MLTPDYLLHCTDSLTELLDAYDNAVVSDIARRIVKTGYVTETAKHQIRQAQQMGLLYDDIIQEIAQRTNITDSMVRTLFENAGVETVRTDNRLYTAAGLQPTDLRASPAMLQMLQAGYENTLGTMHNLTLTTANTAQQAYISACDLAMLQVQSGAMSYQQAIRAAIQSAASDGTRVLYPSGRTDRIEVAVRRAVLTGVAKTCRTIGEYNAASCGCDLMELSAHAGARPSHARWQGQLVSLSGKRGYLSKDDIGYGSGDGFGGYNCRHDWYPFFPGISQRNYSQEKLNQLETMTVNYNGQEIPYYDATQEQRRLERRVRDCKLRLSATDAARQETKDPKLRAQLDEDFAKQSKALREARDKLADFQTGTGLLPDTSRTQVYGFGRSIAQKAVAAQKRVDKSGGGGIMKATEMFRQKPHNRKIGEDGKKRIDQATYHRIVNPAIRKGANIQLADGEWKEHLGKNRASAVTIGDTIFFTEDATVSDVLEEVHHFYQNKSGLNAKYDAKQREVMNEIEAKEYLLSVKEKYNIPPEEIADTEEQLRNYQQMKEEMRKRGDWDED